MTEPKPCCHDYFSVCDVLQRKAIKGVVSAEPTMTVRDAAALMLSAGVGSLLVLEGPRLVGIITERDVFLCGPPVVMRMLSKDLAALGVPATRVFSERFSLQ